MNILDCTMRDGGYHNNWDFTPEFAQNYLCLMESLGIQFAEVGFRFLKNEGFNGAFAFTTDEFLTKLEVPKNLQIGVMINASEFDLNSCFEQLEMLFKESTLCKISFVRVAASFAELKVGITLCKRLKRRFGFKVFLNVMQMSSLDEKHIDEILQEDLTFLEALYFADSTGSMKPTETTNFYRRLRENSSLKVGIHAHDNLGMAFANSLLAINEGASWCDGTLMGMGRGAGNTKTELLWLEQTGDAVGDPQWIKLSEFLNKEMCPIKEANPWGESLEFALGALQGIHPTFVQNLKDNKLLSFQEKFIALKRLSNADYRRFSNLTLESALDFSFSSQPKDNPLFPKVFSSQNVLLITNSELVGMHIEAIIAFIKKYNPVVFCVNFPRHVPLELVNFIATCNSVRMEEIISNLDRIKCPIIVPIQYLEAEGVLNLKSKELVDFPISVKPDLHENLVEAKSIPKSLSALYALNLLLSNNPRRVFLAGFDGQGLNEVQKNELSAGMTQLINEAQMVEVISILESFLSIPTKSVYGSVQVD